MAHWSLTVYSEVSPHRASSRCVSLLSLPSQADSTVSAE